MAITVVALRETAAGERRVAITPEMAKKMRGRGWRVLLERDAGAAAGFPDALYADTEFASAAEVCAQADVLACVLPPADGAIADLRQGAVLVGQLRPYGAAARIAAMAARKLAAYALELLPRTTRAQAMDVLSSQAAVAGYRAIKVKNRSLHKRLMVSAFCASSLFLVGYLAYHYVHGDTKFLGQGPIRVLYFSVLISHVLLSIAIVPMALASFYFALQERFKTHAKVARILYPVWLYVSVTGVAIFFLLRAHS